MPEEAKRLVGDRSTEMAPDTNVTLMHPLYLSSSHCSCGGVCHSHLRAPQGFALPAGSGASARTDAEQDTVSVVAK